jgi:RNA polymerase sigma-70 factor (family 1)
VASVPYINRAGARLCMEMTLKEDGLPEPRDMLGGFRPYLSAGPKAEASFLLMLAMAEYKTISDNELIELLKGSDHSAFNEIYHRYFYLIFTHAYKKLPNEEQAKDIVQDVFASLWFKREVNLPTSNLAGYLYTAVRNKIFDLFAHQQVQSKYLDSLNAYLTTQVNIPTDHLIRENQLKAYIEKEIQALTPKMRLIFEMSRKENLSHKEIAEKLGTTENNVSTQVTTALRILRTKLGLITFIFVLLNSK